MKINGKQLAEATPPSSLHSYLRYDIRKDRQPALIETLSDKIAIRLKKSHLNFFLFSSPGATTDGVAQIASVVSRVVLITTILSAFQHSNG